MKRTLIALFSPLALLVQLLVWQVAVFGQFPAPNLTEKHLARAERVIAKLEKLDVFIKSNPSLSEYGARIQPMIADVYKQVGSLPESDAKADIATAARFYELSGRTSNKLETFGSAITRCANEKPGRYQSLCESTSGSRRELLLAKARLHVAWAKASIDFQRDGAGDVVMLREIEVERKKDQALAKRAVAALRLLEDQVVAYSSLSDFQSDEKLARVPYETFSDELRRVSAEVKNIVSWLPENKLKFEISNALYSYQDGGLRWASVNQPKVVNVSDLTTPAFSTQSTTAYQLTVPYTVAINWRQAHKYLQKAEDIMGRLE
jgi:hypothetical protein